MGDSDAPSPPALAPQRDDRSARLTREASDETALGSAVIVDVELDYRGILRVAEAVEQRRYRFYAEATERSADETVRRACGRFARRSDQRARELARTRTRVEPAASPTDGAVEPGPLPHQPHVIAGLAFFTGHHPTARPAPPMRTPADVLHNARERAHSALLFYDGLKGFTRDHAAHSLLDDLIQAEHNHLRQLAAS